MSTISKLTGIDTAGILSINGVAKENITSVLGAALGGGILLADRTRTAIANTSFTSGVSYNFNLPPTAVDGDLVLFFLGTDTPFNAVIFGTPTGWTSHFGWASTTADSTGQLFTKVLDAADVASGVVSIPCIQSASTRDAQSWTMIGKGVDTTTPVSDVGAITISTSNTLTINSITPSANGLAVGFWGFDGGDGEPTTITAGWTKLEEDDIDSSGSGNVSGFASINTTSGIATGNLQVTFIVSDGVAGIIVNLKAA